MVGENMHSDKDGFQALSVRFEQAMIKWYNA